MFHQVNGTIGFVMNWEAQREMIGEYLRKVVQQLEDVRVGWCLRVLDGLGNRIAIDYAILGEVHQVLHLGPVLRRRFHQSSNIHIRDGKETSITREGYMCRRTYSREEGW